MHITTTEDSFEYNIKKVLKKLKEEYPHLRNQSSETLQDEMWNSRDLQESFTRKMIEQALEYGGDEIFEFN